MASKRHGRRIAWILASLVLMGGAFVGYLNRPRPEFNVASRGLALDGYDPVGYFPEGGGTPQRGVAQWSADHEGRHYQFASAANRERFLAEPTRYEPQFGGWCTYAVAHGYKFEVDPHSYLVMGDRLLLFYMGAFGDARADFEEEGASAGLDRAEANWAKIGAAR